MKYLLLKTAALEEGAQSHTEFGLSYLCLVCRTGRELSLVPDRVGETFTNTILAAEHTPTRNAYPELNSLLSHSCYCHLVSLPAGVYGSEGIICQI